MKLVGSIHESSVNTKKQSAVVFHSGFSLFISGFFGGQHFVFKRRTEHIVCVLMNVDNHLIVVTAVFAVKSPGKRRTVERFNFNADEAIMIGDTVFDINMGKNAGVKTCGVTYGNGSKESLSDADWIIDDFGSLVELIG